MNREQAKERAQVMLAWAEGKEVQFRGRNGAFPERWVRGNGNALVFDFDNNEYRIKPVPVERWGVEYADGSVCTRATKEAAEALAPRCLGGRVFLMREVIEE